MLLLAVYAADAQSTFQKTFGGSTDDYAYSIQHTQDGNLVMAGRSLSYGVGQYDLYIIKMTPAGDTLWCRTYGNIGYDEAFHIDTTADGGLVACGTNSTYDWAGDLFIMKLNADGTLAWGKNYGGNTGTADAGYAVRQTSDGGFIATGSTDSFGSGNADVYVVKTDDSGTIQWTRTIGGGSDDVGRDIIQSSTGDYYISGYTESFGQGFMDVYFIKLNSAGTVMWTKVYGGGSYDFAYTVEETTDNGFVLGATTNSYGQGDMEALLIKTDVSGNIQWAKAYGRSGEDRAQVARQTSDGGYIMAGRTSSFGGGSYDSYLIKTNSAGTMEWDIAQGGGSWDQAWDVQEMSDQGFVVAGYTLSYGEGGREAFVHRTDATGQSGCFETSNAGTVTTSVTMQTTTGGTSGSGGIIDTPPTAIRTGTVINVQCDQSSTCPESIFLASVTETCVGDTVWFTNSSTDALTYEWLVDGFPFGTTTDNQYIFQSIGTHFIQLIAESALCNDTSGVAINVYEPATIDAGDDQLICVGSSAQLNGSFSGALGIEWSTSGTGGFNDSFITNPIYTPSLADEQNGQVFLYATAIDPSIPCPAEVDNMVLTIDLCVGISEQILPSSKVIQRSDILGRPVEQDHNGIQIILLEDGTVRKEVRTNFHLNP